MYTIQIPTLFYERLINPTDNPIVSDWLSKYSRVNINSSANLSWNQPTWKKLFETYKNILQLLCTLQIKNDDNELFSKVSKDEFRWFK